MLEAAKTESKTVISKARPDLTPFQWTLSIGVLVLSVLTPAALAGVPVDLALRPRPQTYTDSCQSYGLAFAAASVPGSPLQAATAKELRVTERELRLARDALARAANRSPYDHTVWKQALEQVSAGALTTDIRYVADIDHFMAEVEKATGVSNAQTLGPVLAAALMNFPVLTSVESIGNDKYASGHIVSVIGLARKPAPPHGLAMLNPAVKIGSAPERVACQLDDGVGDNRYQAFATIEYRYALKRFQSGYLLLTVRKR